MGFYAWPMKAAWRLEGAYPATGTTARMTHLASLEIRAPAARAWEVLSDVQSWPAWLPTVERVEAPHAWLLAIGRRYRVAQPKLRPAVWKVTALEPGKHSRGGCLRPACR